MIGANHKAQLAVDKAQLHHLINTSFCIRHRNIQKQIFADMHTDVIFHLHNFSVICNHPTYLLYL